MRLQRGFEAEKEESLVDTSKFKSQHPFDAIKSPWVDTYVMDPLFEQLKAKAINMHTIQVHALNELPVRFFYPGHTRFGPR